MKSCTNPRSQPHPDDTPWQREFSPEVEWKQMKWKVLRLTTRTSVVLSCHLSTRHHGTKPASREGGSNNVWRATSSHMSQCSPPITSHTHQQPVLAARAKHPSHHLGIHLLHPLLLLLAATAPSGAACCRLPSPKQGIYAGGKVLGVLNGEPSCQAGCLE